MQGYRDFRLGGATSWEQKIDPIPKNIGQYRTEIMRHIRSQNFRQIRQNDAAILCVLQGVLTKYGGNYASR